MSDERRSEMLRIRETVLIFWLSLAVPFCAAQNQERKNAKDIFTDPRVLELALAAEKGDAKEIDKLVENGVDVNAKGRDGVTPLLHAFRKKNKEGFSALLRHKANPNVFTSDDRADAVVNEAAAADDPFWLGEALKHGGKPNLQSDGNRFTQGDTPLFYAVLEKRPENVKLLIKAKADVNHKNGKRGFPLLLAAGRQSYDIVHLLLEAGADFRQKDHNDYDLVQHLSNRNGKSVVEDEQRKWFFKTVDVLKAKGAKFELRKD